MVALRFAYIKFYHSDFMSSVDQFTAVFTSKMQMSMRLAEINYELRGFPHEYDSFHQQFELVASIYNSYHLQGVSPIYQEFVMGLTTSNVCNGSLKSILSSA